LSVTTASTNTMRDSVLITGTGAVAACSFVAGLGGSGGACARIKGQEAAMPLTASINIQFFLIEVFPHERTACSSVRYNLIQKPWYNLPEAGRIVQRYMAVIKHQGNELGYPCLGSGLRLLSPRFSS